MDDKINICWLGQGGFLLESDGTRIVLDPYISNCVFKAEGLARLHPFPLDIAGLHPDLLLITHDHLDHFDPEGIPEILSVYPDCHGAGTQNSYNHFLALGTAEKNLTLCRIGECFTAGSFKITAIPAFHSDKAACGYLLESRGKKIVVTGDTRFDENLFVPEINHADLLLICINGKCNNMNDSEAVEYVRKTMPHCAVPMHFGLFAENTADPENFIAACQNNGVKSFAAVPGEFFSI